MRSLRLGFGVAAAVGVLSALLASPANAATLYVSNEAAGTIEQYPGAGTGGSTPSYSGTPASFFTQSQSYGVTVDGAGNVFSVAFPNLPYPVFGNSSSGSSLGNSPTFGAENVGIAQYNGTLYVSSYANNEVYQVPYTVSGGVATYSTPTAFVAAGANGLAHPMGESVGSVTYLGVTTEYLYVADTTNDIIRAYYLSSNSGGTIGASAGTYNLTGTVPLYQLAVNAAGNIFVDDLTTPNTSAANIYQVTPTGSANGQLTFGVSAGLVTGGTAFSGGKITDALLGMAFGPDNNLYVADEGGATKQILEVNIDGNGTSTQGILNSYETTSGVAPYTLAFSPTATPEPSSACLLALGTIGLLARRRRNRPIAQ